MLSVKLN